MASKCQYCGLKFIHAKTHEWRCSKNPNRKYNRKKKIDTSKLTNHKEVSSFIVDQDWDELNDYEIK